MNPNQRIARLYRELMWCYSHRWKVIRGYPADSAQAARLLERARYCRLQAQIFSTL